MSKADDDFLQKKPALKRYFEMRSKVMRPRSLEGDLHAHRCFWEYLEETGFEGDELSVTREVLKKYAEHVFSNEKLSSNTARNRIYKLKHFYNEAVKQGWAAASPWVGIQLPKVEKNPITVLTVKEIKALLEVPDLSTLKGIRDRAMFELMYSCALRCSELLQVKAEDFGEDYRTLRVVGKGDKEAMLPVGKMAAHFVRFYAEQVKPALQKDRMTGEPLFSSVSTGTPIGKQALYTSIRTHAKKVLGDKLVGTHVFRYSACTHLADEGVDIRVIQEFMRHNKPSTTARYIQQSYQQLQRVYKDAHPRS